jgi:hypothetical protein
LAQRDPERRCGLHGRRDPTAGTAAMWHLIDPDHSYTKPPKVDLNQRDEHGHLVFD